MSSPAPFESISTLFERSLSIRHVYGEPVHHDDTTVIPVAKVVYGFGAGGGQRPGHPTEAVDGSPVATARPEAQGAGGGGGVRMTPVGALEIGPQGTRFVRFHPLAPLLGAGALGCLIGLSIGGWLFSRTGAMTSQLRRNQ